MKTLKTFQDLAKKLSDGADYNSRMVNMVSTLAQPQKCRGIIISRTETLAWAMIVGEGKQAFIPSNLTELNDLQPGDVIEMMIVENDYSHRNKTPYRAVMLTKLDGEIQPVSALAPAPTPRIPRVEGLQPGTFADEIGPDMLDMMKPGFLYRARDFVHLAPENNSKKLTNVLEALLAIGRVHRISLHSSPEKRAGRLYWCLAGQGSQILAKLLEHQVGEDDDDG